MPPEYRPAAPGLDSAQRWLQAVIVHPGAIEEALAAPEAVAEVSADAVEAMVRPSWSLSAAERVDVYHGMYLVRMVEAMEADYPALRHFLGEAAFFDLVRDYVQRHPSRSYTLNRLGDRLPLFLRDEPGRNDAAFLAELARAELAVTEVFDEQASPTLDAEALRRVPPPALGRARLRPIRALRLLSLQYSVIGHLRSARDGSAVPRPRRRRTHLAVYRRDYTVRYQELSGDEHALLAALAGGTPLGEAVSAAALRLRASRREDSVFRWFRAWVAEGLFGAIEPPAEPESAAT